MVASFFNPCPVAQKPISTVLLQRCRPILERVAHTCVRLDESLNCEMTIMKSVQTHLPKKRKVHKAAVYVWHALVLEGHGLQNGNGEGGDNDGDDSTCIISIVNLCMPGVEFSAACSCRPLCWPQQKNRHGRLSLAKIVTLVASN